MQCGDFVAFEPHDGNLRLSFVGAVEWSQPGVVLDIADAPSIYGNDASICIDFGPRGTMARHYWCRASDCRVIGEREYLTSTAALLLTQELSDG